MAEFDALGAELPGLRGICLLDEFEFAIYADGELVELAEGRGARSPFGGRAMSRGTVAATLSKFLAPVRWLPASSTRFAIVGRADIVVNFADGSAISEIQVRQMLDKLPELAALQIQVFTPDERGEVVRVVCVPRGPVTSIDFEHVRHLVRNLNVDVADGFQMS